MEIKLYGTDKNYVSYSSLKLWESNPNEYRRIYYEGKPRPDSIYTRFGKHIHDQLEKYDDFYKEIDRTGLREQQILVTISGVKVKAYIDYIDLRIPLIRDYKTSIKPWTPAKVQDHEQLPFYSLLVEHQFGIKVRDVDILWLETQHRQPTIKRGGVTISGEKELFLTGYWEIIKRPYKVTASERKRLKDWLIKTANEIQIDYEKYRSKG